MSSLRARRTRAATSGNEPIRSSQAIPVGCAHLIRILLFAALIAIVAAVPVGAALASPSSNPKDVALATRIALRISDFPAGWSVIVDASKDTGCFSAPLKRNSPTAFVQAKRFSTGENGSDAYQTVVVYGSAAGARRALSAVASSSSFACYRGKLPAVLAPAKVKLESFTGGPLSFDHLCDQVRAFRYKAAVSAGGQKGNLYVDYIFVVRGRIVISAGFTNSDQLDVSTEHAIIQKSVARAPA